MMNITVYDLASGKILRRVSVVNPADIELQYANGEGVVEGDFDPQLYYVEKGEAVEKPSRPNSFSIFDMTTKTWIETADLLLSAKASAHDTLNNAVSQIRRAFITDLPGQEMIYLGKEEEARRYLATTPEPTTLDEFPMMASEIGITAESPYQLAQIWAYMSQMWRLKSAQIEQVRLQKGAEIAAATTVDEVWARQNEASMLLEALAV